MKDHNEINLPEGSLRTPRPPHASESPPVGFSGGSDPLTELEGPEINWKEINFPPDYDFRGLHKASRTSGSVVERNQL